MADYLGQFSSRAEEFLNFSTAAKQAKSKLLSDYSKVCTALRQLESAISDCQKELDTVLEELQYSIEKASDDDLSTVEEEAWNEKIRQLQERRTQLTESLNSMENSKREAEETKETLRAKAGNLKMQCRQRLNMIDQFESDCKAQISKLEKDNKVAGQLGGMQFGGTGKQMGNDVASRIRSYYGLMSNSAAAKIRIKEVLQSSSSSGNNHDPDVPEREIADELER